MEKEEKTIRQKENVHNHVMMVKHDIHETPVESLNLEIVTAEFGQALRRAVP